MKLREFISKSSFGYYIERVLDESDYTFVCNNPRYISYIITSKDIKISYSSSYDKIDIELYTDNLDYNKQKEIRDALKQYRFIAGIALTGTLLKDNYISIEIDADTKKFTKNNLELIIDTFYEMRKPSR